MQRGSPGGNRPLNRTIDTITVTRTWTVRRRIGWHRLDVLLRARALRERVVDHPARLSPVAGTPLLIGIALQQILSDPRPTPAERFREIMGAVNDKVCTGIHRHEHVIDGKPDVSDNGSSA